MEEMVTDLREVLRYKGLLHYTTMLHRLCTQYCMQGYLQVQAMPGLVVIKTED